MARLFVAIDIPFAQREDLANLCYGIQGAKWVKIDQLHLTLRFIGEVNDALFHGVADALDEIYSEPFSLSLKGVGYFPPRKSPRVLWVGADGGEPLLVLQDSIEKALRRAGLEPEKKKFRPHITIARFKERISKTDLGEFIAGHSLFKTSPFTIDAFSLYSSTLLPQGAMHTRECTFYLGGSSVGQSFS